jgi:hypothetical protein
MKAHVVWAALALLAILVSGEVAPAPVLLGVDVVSFWDLNHGNGTDGWLQGLLNYTWHGYTWSFGTSKNLDKFKLNPTHFAPSYGGYCSYAWATGSQLDCVQPRAWFHLPAYNRLFFV